MTCDTVMLPCIGFSFTMLCWISPVPFTYNLICVNSMFGG